MIKWQYQLIHFNLYSDYIDIDFLTIEIQLWNKKWIIHLKNNRSSTAVESLNCCNSDLYPGVHFLIIYTGSFNNNARKKFFNTETGIMIFAER